MQRLPWSLALCLTLLAGPVAGADERLAGFEPSAEALAGLYGSAYSFAGGGRSGQPFAALQAEVRGNFGIFAWDAAALGLLPFASEGSRALGGYALRGGLNTSLFRGLVGLAINKGSGASAQLLPSLTLEAGQGDLRGVLGIFDRAGLVPLRLGVAYKGYSLCYVPALGLEAAAELAVAPGLRLEGRLLVYKLLALEGAAALVGLSFDLSGGSP